VSGCISRSHGIAVLPSSHYNAQPARNEFARLSKFQAFLEALQTWKYHPRRGLR